jgi:hypothetical protein
MRIMDQRAQDAMPETGAAVLADFAIDQNNLKTVA